MPDEEDTRPDTPTTLHPTLTTVSRQVAALSAQLAGVRALVHALPQELAEAESRRQPPAPVIPITSGAPPAEAESRPSMAVKAALQAWGVGKGGLMLLGALGVVAQILSLRYPELEGPLQVLAKVLSAASGSP